MFSNTSNYVQGVDTAFIVILSIIIFFLIGLTTALVIFIIKYNEKKHPKAAHFHSNNTLEIIWTIIPLALVMAMFYFGWTGYTPMESKPPDNSLPIKVTARMWSWSFEYPNGRRTDTLYVPQGEPIALHLTSLDVIHAFYIPAFRIKKDMVPGKDREAWFIANSPGSYDLFCAEYCGLEHSSMLSTVEVLPKEKFEKWLADTSTGVAASVQSPVLAGKTVLQKYGCNACHSFDGSRLLGPSYKGLFGERVTVITNGAERDIVADEAYIRRSILNPNTDIVKGFQKGLMLSYEGQITDEEINQVIEYLKTLH